MAIEVSCRKCGKAYHVREERAGTKIRCKDCQATIEVPALDNEADADEFGGDASWEQEEARALPGRTRSSPTTAAAVAAAAATFTVRKVLGVLALMLAGLMCLGWCRIEMASELTTLCQSSLRSI